MLPLSLNIGVCCFVLGEGGRDRIQVLAIPLVPDGDLGGAGAGRRGGLWSGGGRGLGGGLWGRCSSSLWGGRRFCRLGGFRRCRGLWRLCGCRCLGGRGAPTTRCQDHTSSSEERYENELAILHYPLTPYY
jgi:hypothetical protein